jgi:trigger factor
VPEYRGLSAKVRAAGVEEAEIDAELARLREQAARYDPIEDRPSQQGDFVLLDLAWRPEGGKPGRDENALVEVGHEGNHADLNAALVGLSPGDAREVRLSYPADHSGSLAGKTVDYVLTLKSVKRKVLPELDDEFAKDLGEFGSLGELREDVRRRLLAAEERRADREAKASLIEALVAQASFEVPEALVERHMSARTENAARGLAYQGIDPSKLGMDWRKYREEQREDSVKAAKADILLDEIARREGIETTSAELDAELDRYAQRLGKSRDALRAQMEKEGDLTALGARIREEKTLDLLKANARLDFE